MPQRAHRDHAIAAIARGDSEAMAEFYREHAGAVLASLRSRVGDRELAFDLTAETFAAASDAAGSFTGEGPAIAWLLGIARNKLADSYRRGRVAEDARRRLGLEPVALDDEALAAIDRRATAGASELEQRLADLPEALREAVSGRVLDELPYPELAARLECSSQVVRQRVHRGLDRLRAGLEDPR